MLDEYLEKYRKQFGEQFPLMACLDMDENEIIIEIKKCIKKNSLYKYKTDRFY